MSSIIQIFRNNVRWIDRVILVLLPSSLTLLEKSTLAFLTIFSKWKLALLTFCTCQFALAWNLLEAQKSGFAVLAVQCARVFFENHHSWFSHVQKIAEGACCLAWVRAVGLNYSHHCQLVQRANYDPVAENLRPWLSVYSVLLGMTTLQNTVWLVSEVFKPIRNYYR